VRFAFARFDRFLYSLQVRCKASFSACRVKQ
jgi:hypothetical protein